MDQPNLRTLYSLDLHQVGPLLIVTGHLHYVFDELLMLEISHTHSTTRLLPVTLVVMSVTCIFVLYLDFLEYSVYTVFKNCYLESERLSCNECRLPILKGVSHVCHARLPYAPGAAMTLLGLSVAVRCDVH